MNAAVVKKVLVPATLFSFILGCFFAYFFAPAVTYSICGVIVFAAVAVLVRRKVEVVLLCVCIAAMLLGVLRVTVPGNHQENALAEMYETHVVLEGFVVGDIEHKNARSSYVVAVTTVNNTVLQKRSSVLVYEPYPTACATGESVLFRAKLREPESFLTSSGRIFAYKKYLRQLGIHAVVSVQNSSCTGERERHAFFARLRKRMIAAMHTFLPMEEASLLGGLLLGLRGALSPDLLEAFRVTGLIHIIVLSGYNVTLVAEVIRRLFSQAPRLLSSALSFAAIVGFVLLAGAQVAAVRAGSMATVALIARATHREYDGIRALLAVAVLMVLYNPDQVLFSVSFHLSFLATLGLLLFAPVIERYLSVIPEKLDLRGIVASTIATQLFLLPYLAHAIGEVSLIGIPANILVIPIIPIAMLFGLVVSVVALISLPIAVALSPLAFLPLRAITSLAELLARIPHATLPLPEVAPVLVLFTLLFLTGFGHYMLQKQKEGEDAED